LHDLSPSEQPLPLDAVASTQGKKERDMAKTKTLAAAAPRSFPTTNPATGESGRVHQGHTVEQAISIATDVYRAQSDWRRTPFSVR
jgi:acyl-CoA reductase-like NAD-dependent aldehyde dehydrogenase